MSEVTIASAMPDDARTIGVRRKVDDASLRLCLALADAGSAWVAKDGSEIVGVATASVSDDERYVGDLYVEPSFRGQGIARKLLAAALEDAQDAAIALFVDPNNAAGVALALRYGLLLQTPVLRLSGAIPRKEGLAAMAAGDYRFEVGPVDPIAHAFALNELDRECRGTTRLEAHRRFALSATGQVFFLRGEMVGYAYVWPDGRIGPLATSSPSYLVQIFAFALVTLQRTYGASWCTLWLPGANVRAGRAALRAGLRVESASIFATDSPPVAFERYVAAHPILF